MTTTWTGLLGHLAALTLVVTIVSVSPAAAQTDEGQLSPDTLVSVDFDDARLVDVVVYISHLTGENFVLMEQSLDDERLTVYAPAPMKVSEVDDFLRSVLIARGFDVARRDAYWAVARIR